MPLPEAQAFDVAVVGSVLDGPPNGPARIFLSPTLMMAEAIGTGDILAVALLGRDQEPVNLSTLCQGAEDRSSSAAGELFTLAEAWPSPKLARDAARLSGPLSQSLFTPPGGSLLRIFPLRKGTPESSKPITLIETKRSDKSKVPTRASLLIRPCSHLELLWVPPTLKKAPEFSPLTPPTRNSALPAGPPDSETTDPPRRPPASPKTPNQRGRRQSQPSPKGRRNSSGGVVSSPSPSPLKREQQETSVLEMTEGQKAAISALLVEGKGKSLIETFAARWLAGRFLVDGNLVTLPLCGASCTFRVARPELSDSGAASESSTPRLPLVAFLVGSTTRMSLKISNQSDLRAKPDGKRPERERNSGKDIGDLMAEHEKVGYSELGGVGEQIKALRELVEMPLRRPEMFRRYGIRPPRGVLLYGPSGTGKTLLARAAASESGASMFVINGPEIVSAHYGESEQALRDVFVVAAKAAPSVIFIDELDAIAPARDTGTEDMAQRMVAALLTLLDGGTNEYDRVIVIAATNRPETIDPALRRPGRFDRELEIGVPTPKGRLDILHTLLRNKRHSLKTSDVNTLAAATHGFVGADLAALCNEAALNALRRIVQKRKALETALQQTSGTGGQRVAARSDEHLDRNDGCGSKLEASASRIDAERDQKAEYSQQGDAGRGVKTIENSQNAASPLADRLASLALDSTDSKSTNASSPLESSQAEFSIRKPQNNPFKEETTLDCEPPCITLSDFEAAQTKVRPSAMREVTIEVPRVKWRDIGGQKATKQKLQETVEWPQKHPEAFSRVGAQAPRGVLLYGPPGCSKTLMARAVATEAGLNFIAVKGPELFSKWVGESEKAVRALFARARASAPSIIFFDEIDGLAAPRDDGSTDGGTGVTERVMSQLLTEMDGLSPLTGVAIIGATNRPDIIDPALLRPGRFDRMLFVGPPDESAREDIFRIRLRETPCETDVRISELAKRTEKYTGADIGAVCREAALAALEEDLAATGVAQRHFDAALRAVGPSISERDEAFYASFQRG